MQFDSQARVAFTWSTFIMTSMLVLESTTCRVLYFIKAMKHNLSIVRFPSCNISIFASKLNLIFKTNDYLHIYWCIFNFSFPSKISILLLIFSFNDLFFIFKLYSLFLNRLSSFDLFISFFMVYLLRHCLKINQL